jgi:hypothetical protein
MSTSEQQPNPTPPQDRYPLVYDPATDTVYDLANGIAKELHWKSKSGETLLSRTGDPAQLTQFWNAATQQLGNNSPFHPQTVLAEATALFIAQTIEVEIVGSPSEETPDSVPFDPRMMMLAQFVFGMGLFMSRRGVTLKIRPRQIGEVEMVQVKKKFGYDFE